MDVEGRETMTQQVVTNIRLLKSLRRLSDDDIAERGGFSSRQVVNNRIGGRSPLALDDIARFAQAFGVAPHSLLLPTLELVAWFTNNPNYEAPPAPPSRRRRPSTTRTATRARNAKKKVAK